MKTIRTLLLALLLLLPLAAGARLLQIRSVDSSSASSAKVVRGDDDYLRVTPSAAAVTIGVGTGPAAPPTGFSVVLRVVSADMTKKVIFSPSGATVDGVSTKEWTAAGVAHLVLVSANTWESY